MAQQSQLALDRETEERRRQGILPSASTGVRTLNFLGGQTDPETGNVIPGSAVQANRGAKPTGSEVPVPKTPTTQLGNVTGEPQHSEPIPAPVIPTPPVTVAPTPAPVAAPTPPAPPQHPGDASPTSPAASLSIGEKADYSYDAYSGSAPAGSGVGKGGGPADSFDTSWGGGGGGGGGGSGGTVLCTLYYRRGVIPRRVYLSDMAYGLHRASPATLRGYHAWAVPLVNILESGRHPRLDAFMQVIVRAWAHEMHHVMSGKGKSTLLGKALRFTGLPVCWTIGQFVPGEFVARTA